MDTHEEMNIKLREAHQNLREERSKYTDEQARKLGYPSAEVLRMTDQLSDLAGEWRETKDDTVALKYQNLLYNMILKGFNVDDLDVQDYLPERFMPELPSREIQTMLVEAYRQKAG